MRKNLLLTVGSLILTTLFLNDAQAQSATATLSGTVTDEQGAVVSGASVTITDNAKAFDMQRCQTDCGEADWESFWGAISFGV